MQLSSQKTVFPNANYVLKIFQIKVLLEVNKQVDDNVLHAFF